MKKGFTLIELLAVIIILAIVALIATPIIINVIEDSKKSANRSQVELLLGGAKQIYAQNYLNEEYKVLLTDTNIYGHELFQFSKELPGVGVVKIKDNGEIFLAVEIDGICYTKDYEQDEISENKLSEGDTCVPLTVTMSPQNTNSTNIYSNDINVEIYTNGDAFKYCTQNNADITQSINNCTPTTLVNSTTHNLIITEEGKTKVCALPIKDGSESSEIICYEYKLDKTIPTITAKTEDFSIKQGQNIDFSTYFDTTFGPTGGQILCKHNSTSNLTADNNTLTCKAVGNNGIESTEASKTITVEVPCEDSLIIKVDLPEGLIPVVIAPNGTVTKADATNKYDSYYSYCKQQWANAVMINNDADRDTYQNASEGTTIDLNSISAYYVYIPRYEYKIFDTDTTSNKNQQQLIDVKFVTNTESKKTTPTLNEYYTHPAFTFGDTELNGIWVGKFEMTGTETTPTILPDITASTSLLVSQFFNSIIDMDTDYKVTNADTHMLKNMEWGAMAYLSHSKYGISGEIRINNTSTFITGCGASTASANSLTTCSIRYGSQTNNIYPQSTTGNISGIFDTSGGGYEYVMGYQDQNHTTDSGLAASFFTDVNNLKYFDTYSYGGNYTEYHRGQYGDATREVSGWYSDYALFVNSSNSWLIRGGFAGAKSNSGMFMFYFSGGNASSNITSRAALVTY